MAVLCTDMQSGVQELTGRKTVLFTNSSFHRRRRTAITGCRRVITNWDTVIGSTNCAH
ncbi:unnamed protein product, partial [Staurois parvus]